MPIPNPPPIPVPRGRDRREQIPNSMLERTAANQAYGELDTLVPAAMRDTVHDWISLECLANAKDYSKSDTQKRFILWEATTFSSVEVSVAANAATNHPWVIRLFRPNGATVRFPFNTGDSSEIHSLSWHSASRIRKINGRFYELPRWSTASRSSVALVPQHALQLQNLGGWQPPDRRCELVMLDDNKKVNIQEWLDLQNARQAPMNSDRFSRLVPDIGVAVGVGGVTPPGWNGRWRLYSIKTGVHYVGTKKEGQGTGNKHLLEANSTMAMLRSDVAGALPNNDDTFGLQGEILTVTAPMDDGTRDGFQVRDLSCMRPGLKYVPCQAIPYARGFLDLSSNHDEQATFWRDNFAKLLGRAKARLFLNYGLIHTSANAQNFLLGYKLRGQARIEQFVARDLGDTSWHDDFIAHYLSHFARGMVVFRGFRQEAGAPVRHTLHATSSGAYPAPDMLRLASFSVITHDFGTRLGWGNLNLHRFVTGVFDGFIDYLYEAIGLDVRYPDPAPHALMLDDELITLGTEGAYPHMVGAGTYRARVNTVLAQNVADLVRQAAYVRRRGRALLTTTVRPPMQQVLNAEEILLCGAVEKHLRTNDETERRRLRQRLTHCFDGHWPNVVP